MHFGKTVRLNLDLGRGSGYILLFINLLDGGVLHRVGLYLYVLVDSELLLGGLGHLFIGSQFLLVDGLIGYYQVLGYFVPELGLGLDGMYDGLVLGLNA